jgi:Uma2 family endonuclease
MATSALISVEEYLRSDWSPDREYVDGEVQERNSGEFDHATLQHYLQFIFETNAASWRITVRPELRLQVSQTRFRVPDVMILREGQRWDPVIRQAPLLCIEILSPEDRFGRVEEKVVDYLKMGVSTVWVIDPVERRGYQCSGWPMQDWQESKILTVSGTPISIDLPALFERLTPPS